MNQNFSPDQKNIIGAMQHHFGVDPKDVSLDETGELFFSLESLNLLTIRLAPDIQDLSISAHSYEKELCIVNSHASVTLIDGRVRSCVKGAQLEEPIPGGKIETYVQAANISDGRAARACLRMVAFDPVKEFQNYLSDQETKREIEEVTQEEKDRRFIHKVRDDLRMDEATYRQHLSTVTMGEKDSTEGMTKGQLSMCAVFFRGLLTANEMSRKKVA